jgi:hypothetical protein
MEERGAQVLVVAGGIAVGMVVVAAAVADSSEGRNTYYQEQERAVGDHKGPLGAVPNPAVSDPFGGEPLKSG